MKKINRQSLQSEIIESIKSYIEENKLKSGDQLPSQLEMTQFLGISRTSLREALKTLEAHGIIEIFNGKGIYVKDPSSTLFHVKIEHEKEKETLLEIIEVRKTLEHEIIRLVCIHATEEELQRVQDILDVVMDKYYRHESNSKEDLDFHMEFYKICHNKVMIQIAAYVGTFLLKLWENPLGWVAPFTDTVPYHKEMFDHIRRRDFKKAQIVNDKTMNLLTKEILQKD